MAEGEGVRMSEDELRIMLAIMLHGYRMNAREQEPHLPAEKIP